MNKIEVFFLRGLVEQHLDSLEPDDDRMDCSGIIKDLNDLIELE